MAAKRLREGDDGDDGDLEHSYDEKKMKKNPSFETVVKDVITSKSIQKFVTMIEPILRQVVQEEVKRSLENFARSHSFKSRSNLKKIAHHKPSSAFCLEFSKKLSLPIFTTAKIKAEDSDPIQIILVDIPGEATNRKQLLPPSLKLEIVVIDGDFPALEEGDWTAEAFEGAIVRARVGKKPLLQGDVAAVTMKDRIATVEDLCITDNSSWIRCRNFRIGARVIGGDIGGMRIREAISERFTVKDHRGELYKKNHPPSLTDEVWRLEKIGKDGKYHQRLSNNGIETVQEFLKMLTVNQHELRRILGPGMPDRSWEITINHAKNCILGNKYYYFNNSNATIVLNSICQLVKVIIHDHGGSYSPNFLTGEDKNYLDSMVKEAYKHWETLEVSDDVTIPNLPLLQNGEMMLQVAPDGHSSRNANLQLSSCNQIGGYDLVAHTTNDLQVGDSEWHSNSFNLTAESLEQLYPNRMSDFSSDEDDSCWKY